MSREAQREANRARFPWLAEVADATGGKVVWAQDAAGEIGRRPMIEAHLFEVSAEALDALRLHEAMAKRRTR